MSIEDLPLFPGWNSKDLQVACKFSRTPFSDRIESKDEYQEKEVLVSSLRLDAFLSSILKLSRSQTVALVEKKLVQVNYHIVEKSDYQVKFGDLISVRRFGRIILLQRKWPNQKR